MGTKVQLSEAEKKELLEELLEEIKEQEIECPNYQT
jgi:hypothetical protein